MYLCVYPGPGGDHPGEGGGAGQGDVGGERHGSAEHPGRRLAPPPAAEDPEHPLDQRMQSAQPAQETVCVCVCVCVCGVHTHAIVGNFLLIKGPIQWMSDGIFSNVFL